jgi:hypothetical protein
MKSEAADFSETMVLLFYMLRLHIRKQLFIFFAVITSKLTMWLIMRSLYLKDMSLFIHCTGDGRSACLYFGRHASASALA